MSGKPQPRCPGPHQHPRQQSRQRAPRRGKIVRGTGFVSSDVLIVCIGVNDTRGIRDFGTLSRCLSNHVRRKRIPSSVYTQSISSWRVLLPYTAPPDARNPSIAEVPTAVLLWQNTPFSITHIKNQRNYVVLRPVNKVGISIAQTKQRRTKRTFAGTATKLRR